MSESARSPARLSWRRRLGGGVALLLLGAAAGGARAHEVKTTDGRRLEGRIVSKDDVEVVIETTFDGTVRVPRAQVAWIDEQTPPLLEQLKHRAAQAHDAKARWDVYHWAKKKGFGAEIQRYLLEGVLDLAPDDKKARKLLGHERVDGRWMTPEQKAEHEAARLRAEMLAKGLVEHEGEWVTPEERDARLKGLKKDGAQWVTEEEWHLRRGLRRVHGRWEKIGEREGRNFVEAAVAATRVDLRHEWTPHFDLVYEVGPDLAKRIGEAAEKAHAVMRDVLRPTEKTYPHTEAERIRLLLCHKAPAYVRVSQWFAQQVKADEIVPGWVGAIQRQHGYWWVQDLPLAAGYQFPNTDKTFVSNVVHNAAMVLLTRYRWADSRPGRWLTAHHWLREGFAYHLEMEALGYTQSFTIGRGGSGEAPGAQGPVWLDSAQWRTALKALVAEGADPPLRRIAKMTGDMFGYAELVKAWSVVECLIRWDPVRFERFVALTKAAEQEEEACLREAFGVGFAALEDRWRAYVAADYRHPEKEP